MSPMPYLLSRSCADLGTQVFLEHLFLLLSGELKKCRLVCKEWDAFIRGMWRQRNMMLKKLHRNWLKGVPCSQLDIAICDSNASKVIRIVADDSVIAVLMNTNEIKLISCGLIEIVSSIADFQQDGDSLINDIELRLIPSLLIVCHSVCNPFDPPTSQVIVSLFSKQGVKVGAHRSTVTDTVWSFKMAAANSNIALLIRSRISVYEIDNTSDETFIPAPVKVNLLYSIKKVAGVITILKIFDDVFITGDVGGKVKIWNLQTGLKVRTLQLGSAVQDMCLTSNILVTVGGINGAMGVNFWSYGTGDLLKTFYNNFNSPDDGCFCKIAVDENRFIIDGYSHAFVFLLDTVDFKLKELFKLKGHVLGMNKSMLIKARYEGFDGELIVKDFWNSHIDSWSCFPLEF